MSMQHAHVLRPNLHYLQVAALDQLMREKKSMTLFTEYPFMHASLRIFVSYSELYLASTRGEHSSSFTFSKAVCCASPNTAVVDLVM